MAGEIFVVPFFGQGHVLPSMELSKHIASRNFKAIFVIPANISSSIPSSFRHNPLIEVVELPSSPTPPPPMDPGADPMLHHRTLHAEMGNNLEILLSTRNATQKHTSCAIIDVMMGWTSQTFLKFEIPTIGFFTSGACSAAMEYATWKADVENLKPGEIRILPGLPEEMALTLSDLKQRPHGPPHLRKGSGPPGPRSGGPGPKFKGPPKPGHQPPWVEEVAASIAFMFNTCDDLEKPFLDYIADRIGKPVWGVGPLLPEQYWESSGSILHDREIRSKKKSSVTEDEVIQWLDSKPRGSVLYVSFGTEVGPTMEEYPELAAALEQCSNQSFIWVLQPGSGRSGPPRAFMGGGSAEDDEGYFPPDLAEKVGDRGLIIRGWAPQLLILSHPATGGFLSHCGWNSTVEAIGRGIPFLTWPIRGDQYSNSKLLVNHLRIGHLISTDMSESIRKDVIVKGIKGLMGDEGVRERARQLQGKFQSGFPVSSVAALDEFREFIIINQKKT